MTPVQPLYRKLMGHPSVPGLVYLTVMAALVVTAGFALLDVNQRYAARTEAAAALALLQSHAVLSTAERAAGTDARPPGSSFLEGQSITLARAALLQRVTGAISRAGGELISSEIDAQEAADGYVKASVSFEVDQQSLLSLLYDLEAGMPFLFVVQMSIYTSSQQDNRLRVLLGVSGMWRSEKTS